MYFYQAYGLNIHSVLELPELITSTEVNPDVVIQFGQVDCSAIASYREVMYLHTTPEEVTFFWDEVGAMLVRGGKEVIIDPLPDVEERLLHLPLLGMVLAVILHQRGFLTLHGSAVEIKASTPLSFNSERSRTVNCGAAIFLGGKGWGKSTLAATLYARGHNLITDDLIAIDFDQEGNPLILPAFPQLKLLPEAAAFALGDDPETLPRLAHGYDKRARLGINNFSKKPVPIKAIYQLDKGEEVVAKPLSFPEATTQLIGNSFIARCADPLLAGEGGVLHFQQCMNLIKQVPVYRLERPQVLELVPAIAQLIEANLNGSDRLITV